MGGNAALLAGGFAAGFAPNGVGAFLDIGGNAADALLLTGAFATGFAAVFVEDRVGALLDVGVNALEPLASALAPKEKPPDPINEDAPELVFDVAPPNVKPPAPMDEDETASGLAVAPPNENPPAPMDEDETASGLAVDPPNENPPAPMDEDDTGPTLAGAPPRAASVPSHPGRMVSHATHLFTVFLLRTEQTSHFQVDPSTLKKFPSDSVFSSSLSPLSAASPAEPPSSLSLSLSSPSPNNQSIYQSRKSNSYIRLLSFFSFLIVFLCSSSQYTDPNDSITLPN